MFYHWLNWQKKIWQETNTNKELNEVTFNLWESYVFGVGITSPVNY